MIRSILLAVAMIAAPATAADRAWNIGSFERLRVDGPFEVRVTTGGAPRASASAGDPRVLERLRIAVEGGTLTLRLDSAGWRGLGGAVDAPTVVTLATPSLSGVTILSGSKVAVSRMTGTRVDVAVTGSGALTVADIDADAVNATLIGTGAVTLAGRTSRARLATNGSGAIDAGALSAGDLFVSLDGPGETRAAARYTAQVASTGAGRVTVSGNAKCTIRAAAGGPVKCGALP